MLPVTAILLRLAGAAASAAAVVENNVPIDEQRPKLYPEGSRPVTP